MMMRYFLDTEFNGFGGELISIALVPEVQSLAPFYEAIECTNPIAWVKDNVLPVLETRLVDPDIIGPGMSGATPHNAYHDAVALRAEVLAYEQRMAR
jgi:hypothetical protein